MATSSARKPEAAVDGAAAEAGESTDRGPGHPVEHSMQVRTCPGSPHDRAFPNTGSLEVI